MLIGWSRWTNIPIGVGEGGVERGRGRGAQEEIERGVDRGRGREGEKAMLWQFGPGKPRLGGLSVAASPATKEQHIAVVKGAAKRAMTNRVRKGRKAPKAAAACGGME